jgi:hypothetical protein
MVEVDGEVEATVMLRQRRHDVEGGCTERGGDGVASVLREKTVRHRGRWKWHGVGVEGGDDSTEGDDSVEEGGGKSGSLTAQNQIFTMS